MRNISNIILIVVMVIGALAALFAPTTAGLFITYILFGLCIIAAIGFAIMQLVKNPASAKRTLMGVGILLAICLIAYFASSSEVDFKVGKDVTESTLKFVGAGLVLLYILAIVAVVAAIFTEIYRMVK